MIYDNLITALDVFELIDKIRYELQFSINHLCADIIDTASYWRYLNNIRKPNLEIVLKLIWKLGLSYSDFFIRLENYLLNNVG